jgi:UDP-GlcNAc:undecaprenyl-phosphate/decaprenyl-phosphate GlcNAc-1-phosphate transferase
MTSLLAAFFASFITSLLIFYFKHLHLHLSGDIELSSPQKYHVGPVPRIGGISIAIGLLVANLVYLRANPASAFGIALLLCAIPVFAIGLMEDLTKRIGVSTRLLFTALAAGLAAYYLGVQIPRLDVPGIDFLVSIPLITFAFTIIAITGLSNAYNIIDGFNGLCSMVGIMSLLGLAYVSFIVGDILIMHLSLMMASCIMGFFFWNFPKGLIFLGDGGAYLIGFWIALMSILLVARNSGISPWFALLINAYPILETLFTIYRRKIYKGKNPSKPDSIHFHSLIYRRVIKPRYAKNKNNWYSANSTTAPCIWIFTGLALIPAILWWQSTPILITATAFYTILYVWIYRRLVIFKKPKWMSI